MAGFVTQVIELLYRVISFTRTMTERETYGFGEYNATELSHYTITLSDGVTLSCRIWLPDIRNETSLSFSDQFSDFNTNTHDVHLVGDDDQADKILDEEDKFPVILEYLPYYKDILTATRDYNRHPWFASHGFVVMRVEMRGTGASEGCYYGEYLQREQLDCSEILQWIVAQRWSNGRVGMYGKSWGGFNGLQMAYLEPENSPLKTAISLYSTDNRYTDDIHYEGGCPIGLGLLSWASSMFVMDALPPPPRCFTKKAEWLKMWRERLEKSSQSYMSSWTQNQLPSSYWQHGSICTDYDRVTIPVLGIGGLEDGYTTAAERMARKLNSSSKFIIGPWVHNWPDVSSTGPRIEFLELCLNWFTYHLKGTHIDKDNKCTAWPRMQLFVRNSFKPKDLVCSKEGDVGNIGRFVTFEDWVERGEMVQDAFKKHVEEDAQVNPENKVVNVLYLTNDNKVFLNQPEPNVSSDPIQLYSHALQGANSGLWLRLNWGYPGDQTTSIANSVSFCTDPLETTLVMIGVSQFVIKLSASSWRRVYISVKVSDVHPDGFATLVTRCQYDLNYLPVISPHEESNTKTFALPMRFVSHCFLPGHKIAISISPNAFPMMWPSFVPSEVHLYPAGCKLIYQTESLEYLDQNTVTFPLPRPLFTMPLETITPGSTSYLVTHIGDRVKFLFQEESGLEHLPHTMNVKHQERSKETYECNQDVTLGVVTILQEQTAIFDSLSFTDSAEKEVGVKVTTHQVMKGDAEVYTVEEKLCVTWSDSGKEVFSRTWSHVIPRLDHATWK